MRLYGKRVGQDRLAKTTSPYIIYRGCTFACAYACVCADSTSPSTENERNHQPNLLLYILFIYGRMGCNFIFGWKIGENVEFDNENYF